MAKGTAAGLEAVLALKNMAADGSSTWVVPREKWLFIKPYNRGSKEATLLHYLAGWTQEDLDAATRKCTRARMGVYRVGQFQFFKAGGKGHKVGKHKKDNWWAFGEQEPVMHVAAHWPADFVSEDAAVLREEIAPSIAAHAATRHSRRAEAAAATGEPTPGERQSDRMHILCTYAYYNIYYYISDNLHTAARKNHRKIILCILSTARLSAAPSSPSILTHPSYIHKINLMLVAVAVPTALAKIVYLLGPRWR